MTSSKLPALTGAIIGVALTAGAKAADMPDLPVLKAPIQEFYSPWYVRLDGGWRINNVSGGSRYGVPFIDNRASDSPTIGGGVGFKWNWFRSDVTFDFGAQPKHEGFVVAGTPGVTANITNYTMLWNAYADLGSWWGFTPYVGAGIGFSYLTPFDVSTNPATTITVDNKGRAQFSWAATGGAAYAIAPGLLVDANYRYLDLGEARTDVPSLGQINYGDWTAHEFRIGLRYLIQ